MSEKNRSHKAEKEAGRKYDYKSCKSRNYTNVEVHHRSERAKSPPPELLHSAASSGSGAKGFSDDTKGRSRERRQDKAKIAAVDSVHSTTSVRGSRESSKDSSETTRELGKIKTGDGHCRKSLDSKDRKQSCSNQRSEQSSESSKRKGGGSPSRDHRRKEERRREDETRRGDKGSTASDRSRESEKNRSKERNQGKMEVSSKDGEKKTVETSKRSSEEPNITGKSSVEENSPNRKLCFMETLNLTLSPVKKPLLPIDASQQESTPVDKVVENGPNDDSEQPDMEDMCVIDEIDSSQSEIRLDDVADDKVVKCSSDIPKTPSPEIVDGKCDDEKVAQEKDKTHTETTVADEQLEGNSVQTTSASSQLPEATDDQVTVHLTPKSPESILLTATDSDISKHTVDNTDGKIVESGDLEATACLSGMPGSISKNDTSNSLQKANPENQTEESISIPEPSVLDSSVETPRTAVRTSLPVDAVKEDAVASQGNPVAEDVTGEAKPESQQISPSNLPEGCQKQLCPSASSDSTHEKDACNMQDGPKDAEAVSSTISLEAFPQEGLSLPEAIYVLTQTNEDVSGVNSVATEPSSSTGCIGVSKVSSTTEEMTLPDKYRSVLSFTPKKNFSPGKCYTEKEEGNIEPSSSMPLLHDEDSMMRTLSSLKSIPDAISPLRSPIRLIKRNHLHCHDKPTHVKSLRKDFSSTAVDANSMKLDVNKENKYPGSPVKHESQNMGDTASDLPSSLSDNELEEGEILSESEEATAVSPIPSAKRAKLARPVRNQPSPKSASRFSKRISEERCVASKEMNEAVAVSTGSPSNKHRFKTVCPTASKASFSTMEEVMETFNTVRAQIRKKYMKLHKSFPKKSFYGMMDNFQESFLAFVDGAGFGQICNQIEELKAKLKKMIKSVFSKVSNNGIVNRIFEQQAVDLKQKLWEFVGVQLDFLFKDIQSTLTSFCKLAGTEARDKMSSGNEKLPRPLPISISPKLQCRQKNKQPVKTSQKRIKPRLVAPCKTGLGSRGKDIRMTHMEKDGNLEPNPPVCPITQTVVEVFPPNNIPSTPEKSNKASLVLSQGGSFQDRADYEILTEQQASSLTFNLVRDSQMGEIFKCLLQGSDLLDTSATAGDNTGWSISTPRKDALTGESLISITTPSKFISPAKFISPTKFASPSKLIATWSSISPRKMSSPQSKVQVPLNPALFDESCLLEVPSETRTMLQSGLVSQRSYSILAEDLAVSLTIPSPLKSDSHLSFLQPHSMDIMSTPDSVISAHFSEDALLDGEDASEQDIHLALDTDNSSCGSSSSVTMEAAAAPLFQFKPHLPMQAVVMEKSNDHFILKIRQAASSADVTLTADESLSRTLTEEDQCHREEDASSRESPSKPFLSDASQKISESQKITSPSKTSPSKTPPSETSLHNLAESSETKKSGEVPLPHLSDSSGDELELSASDRSLTIAEEVSSTPEKNKKESKMGRKRKKHQEKSKTKRSRKEEEKRKEETVSKSPKDRGTRSSKKEKSKAKSPVAPLSPNSLSAKNVVRKKGEVVMAWTRDEDRAILLFLKTKGASRETFSALSEKLNKPSTQIADRFTQLMKLFKKQEKMDS
uniref:CASP8-associated protein 2 n=1 Tax=Centroberyx gerrardi TaxID=166262 RepID=UPI003AADD1F6